MNFFYDANGNQIRKEKGGLEKWYYTYDFENRLTKVEYFDGSQTSTLGEYFYDGDGKRIKKVESSQTTIYIYLGWNIIYEKESSTMTETKHVFGPNGHVGKIVGGTKYYYHSDHLGSLRQETDESGNTLWSSPMQYEPFGEMRSGGLEQDGYFYTGKLRDASTGLYYYGNRFYDPRQARFLTKHVLSGTASNSQTWNPYIYTLNNPLKYTDPTGNDEEDIYKGASYVTTKSGRVLRVLGSGGPTDVSGENMFDRDGTIVKIIPNNTGTNPSSTVNPTPAPAPTTTPTSNPNPTITGDPSYINGIVKWPTSTDESQNGEGVSEIDQISSARARAYWHRELKEAIGDVSGQLEKAKVTMILEIAGVIAAYTLAAAFTPAPGDEILLPILGTFGLLYMSTASAIQVTQLALLLLTVMTVQSAVQYTNLANQLAILQAMYDG